MVFKLACFRNQAKRKLETLVTEQRLDASHVENERRNVTKENLLATTAKEAAFSAKVILSKLPSISHRLQVIENLQLCSRRTVMWKPQELTTIHRDQCLENTTLRLSKFLLQRRVKQVLKKQGNNLRDNYPVRKKHIIEVHQRGLLGRKRVDIRKSRLTKFNIPQKQFQEPSTLRHQECPNYHESFLGSKRSYHLQRQPRTHRPNVAIPAYHHSNTMTSV